MRRHVLIAALAGMLCLTGCNVEIPEDVFAEKYPIGTEVELGDTKFNIYKVNAKEEELYLLAQESIGTTLYSDREHRGNNMNDYVGSYVYDYIEDYADELQDELGIDLIWYGLIDELDLYDIGKFRHSSGLSGRPYYLSDETPDFVSYVDTYWVGGYCKYNTYSWEYSNGCYDMEQCDEHEYGVRPVICVKADVIEDTQNQ